MVKNHTSVKLTHIIVRLCYVILGALCVALPVILTKGFFSFDVLYSIKGYVLTAFYLVVPAGYAALVCLDKILINVKKDRIFEYENTGFLRIISYACFYAAIVGLVFFVLVLMNGTMFETLIILASGEFFMGLVVRVVKNIFTSAIKIKEENELTI